MIFSFKENLLTKQSINEKVNDQQIYEFYMKTDIDFGRKYNSPYRVDKKPSLSFLVLDDNSILWRDWGDGSQSKPQGVIMFVSKINGNCSYGNALKIIDREMNLNIEKNVKLLNAPSTHIIIPSKKIVKKNKPNKLIQVKPQSYTKEDIAYWSQYKIQLATLMRYSVFSAKYVWLDGTLVRSYSGSNPVYAYKLDTVDKIQRWKIYSPLSIGGNKWLTNANKSIVQGLKNLDLVTNRFILTKSLKDVMVLRILGYESAALQSETSEMPQWFEGFLHLNYKRHYVLYDNDEAGRYGADKLIKESPKLMKIEIPDYLNVKDISDYIKKYGYKKAKLLIHNLIAFKDSEYTGKDLPF